MSTEESHPSDGEGEGEFDPAPHRPSPRALVVSACVGVAAIALLLGAGIAPRMKHRAELREDAARAASEPARVLVVEPTHPPDGSSLALPGSVQPVQETVMYARTSGYVRRYLVDIGDAVKQGQVLAELDTPDLDQELRQTQAAAGQAKAVVEQAETQRDLARKTADRYGQLMPEGLASKQELDEKRASADAQQAGVHAAESAVGVAEANARRVRELKTFGRVIAPFDGVITSRTVENGQLVTPGTAAGQALFKIAKIDVVRVFLNVPQLYAMSVKVGSDARVVVREAPQRPYSGKVTRTAHELDPLTRTLLTEVRIANPDGALLGGMYAQVTLDVKRVGSPLLVPSTAVRMSAEGTQVAVVVGGKIRWRTVQIDGDLGDQMAIAAGLAEGDVVAALPSDKLVEGMSVRAEEAKKP